MSINELATFEDALNYAQNRELIRNITFGIINIEPVFDVMNNQTWFYEDETYVPAYARLAADLL